jgi:hypothetical protein
MTVLEKVLSKIQTLPTVQQQQVLHFIDFLAFELGDRQVKKFPEVPLVDDKPVVSCYDLTKKWIGIADDLPDDLSVNQKYMEGYGS